MNDEEIVDLYWQRDEKAIAETSKKYGLYLSKVAYNILSDYEDSGECVNDTYLAAWNSMPSHKPNVLSSYLCKIIRSISIDVFRKKNAEKRIKSEYVVSYDELCEIVASDTSVEDESNKETLEKAINDFLAGEKAENRIVFTARYFRFDSIKKICEFTGLNEGKVKMILFHERNKLKEYLEREGFSL